jgi:hypothetical protein
MTQKIALDSRGCRDLVGFVDERTLGCDSDRTPSTLARSTKRRSTTKVRRRVTHRRISRPLLARPTRSVSRFVPSGCSFGSPDPPQHYKPLYL